MDRTNFFSDSSSLDVEETAAFIDFYDIFSDGNDEKATEEEEEFMMQNQAAKVINEQSDRLFNFTDIFTGTDDYEDKSAEDKCMMQKPAAVPKGKKLSERALKNQKYVACPFIIYHYFRLLILTLGIFFIIQCIYRIRNIGTAMKSRMRKIQSTAALREEVVAISSKIQKVEAEIASMIRDHPYLL
jgi:hypothetical protein